MPAPQTVRWRPSRSFAIGGQWIGSRKFLFVPLPLFGAQIHAAQLFAPRPLSFFDFLLGPDRAGGSSATFLDPFCAGRANSSEVGVQTRHEMRAAKFVKPRGRTNRAAPAFATGTVLRAPP